jgi:hypothetical protein
MPAHRRRAHTDLFEPAAEPLQLPALEPAREKEVVPSYPVGDAPESPKRQPRRQHLLQPPLHAWRNLLLLVAAILMLLLGGAMILHRKRPLWMPVSARSLQRVAAPEPLNLSLSQPPGAPSGDI